MSSALTFRQFVQPLVWLDGRPLPSVIEAYRWSIFDRAFARRVDLLTAFAYSLVLTGRAKKNWKTADLMLACLFALMDDSPGGNQCYLVANDAGQSRDDLELGKKLIRVNPILQDWVTVRKNVIERRDGEGFVEVLPAGDVVGSHGKTFRFLGIDEIHGQRNWDLLEALAPDPSRLDCQTWITSYASLFHRPGVPLFDLTQVGRVGDDPRMLFDWWAADYCTSSDVGTLTPEERANPSRASWDNPEYLDQQRRRLPAHKFRRLHLNLPGTPDGSAFQPEPVMDAVDRGVAVRVPVAGVDYAAFVDMSGGSGDDAVLAVGHRDVSGMCVLDRLVDQGQRPPFDPRAAVERFVGVLREYRVAQVTGDAYAGQTFRADFERHDVDYIVSEGSKHHIYEALEPLLNSRRVRLLDVPELEQQLLGLLWRGGRIDHAAGEHDDYANACAGVLGALAVEDDLPLMVVGGAAHREWLAAHGGDPADVEDVGAAEPSAPAASETPSMIPRAVRRREHHAQNEIERAARNGGWFPHDGGPW